MRELRCFDVNLIRVLLALVQSYKINFHTRNGLGWLAYSFYDLFWSCVPAFDGVNRGDAFTHPKVLASYLNEYAKERM